MRRRLADSAVQDELLEDGQEALEDLQQDSEVMDQESGVWEGIDPCSLGKAVLYELDHDSDPQSALELALGKLQEDPSYFLEPSKEDYEAISSAELSSSANSTSDSGVADQADGGSTERLFSGSLATPWSGLKVASVISLLDKTPDQIPRVSFMGPPGYMNNYGKPHDSDFFDRDPDLYPEDLNPGFDDRDVYGYGASQLKKLLPVRSAKKVFWPIVSLQGEAADEILGVIREEGPKAGLDLLMQYDDGSVPPPSEVRDQPSKSQGDYWYSWGPYTMYYNFGMEWVTLEGSSQA